MKTYTTSVNTKERIDKAFVSLIDKLKHPEIKAILNRLAKR